MLRRFLVVQVHVGRNAGRIEAEIDEETEKQPGAINDFNRENLSAFGST